MMHEVVVQMISTDDKYIHTSTVQPRVYNEVKQ